MKQIPIMEILEKVDGVLEKVANLQAASDQVKQGKDPHLGTVLADWAHQLDVETELLDKLEVPAKVPPYNKQPGDDGKSAAEQTEISSRGSLPTQ